MQVNWCAGVGSSNIPSLDIQGQGVSDSRQQYSFDRPGTKNYSHVTKLRSSKIADILETVFRGIL